MIKNRLACVAALAVTALALTAPAARTEPPAQPTFSKDVAPILFKNCASCHRPGDIAPMSLLTYENARPWAKAMREQVAAGNMPPWHATQPHGTFSNDRRLSDKDKDTLIRWADGGAQKGDPKDLPPPPGFTDGWEIGTPDAVISSRTGSRSTTTLRLPPVAGTHPREAAKLPIAAISEAIVFEMLFEGTGADCTMAF